MTLENKQRRGKSPHHVRRSKGDCVGWMPAGVRVTVNHHRPLAGQHPRRPSLERPSPQADRRTKFNNNTSRDTTRKLNNDGKVSPMKTLVFIVRFVSCFFSISGSRAGASLALAGEPTCAAPDGCCANFMAVAWARIAETRCAQQQVVWLGCLKSVASLSTSKIKIVLNLSQNKTDCKLDGNAFSGEVDEAIVGMPIGAPSASNRNAAITLRASPRARASRGSPLAVRAAVVRRRGRRRPIRS